MPYRRVVTAQTPSPTPTHAPGCPGCLSYRPPPPGIPWKPQDATTKGLKPETPEGRDAAVQAFILIGPCSRAYILINQDPWLIGLGFFLSSSLSTYI